MILNLFFIFFLSQEVYSDEKIILGTLAKDDEFPYVACVINFRYEREKCLCGGVVISETAVLTAADCLYEPWSMDEIKPNEILVSAGSHDLEESVQKVVADKLIAHPKFKRVKRNDVQYNFNFNYGIIELEKALVYYTNSLYHASWHLDDTLKETTDQIMQAKSTCTTVGWGYRTGRKRKAGFVYYNDTTKLHKAEMQLLSYEECYNYLQWLEPLKLEENGQLCANSPTSPGKGVCGSDVGSPLVCNKVVVGIVSDTIQCGFNRTPAIFSRIDYAVDFIKPYAQKASSKNNASSFYHKDTHFLITITKFFLALKCINKFLL